MSRITRIAEIIRHQVASGESLSSVAQQYGLTRDDLAEYNFESSDRTRVNEGLRTLVGTTAVDARGDYVFSDTDDPGEILVAKPWSVGGLATDRYHTVRVKREALDPLLLACCCVPGTAFAYKRSYIRPLAADHFHALAEALERHPDAQVMVFGHTDRSGPPRRNKALSERRAQSAFAFVRHDPGTWEQLYETEQWGFVAIQEILGGLGYDPGPFDGSIGPKGRGAMGDFLEVHGVDVPTENDPQFREVLFSRYMARVFPERLSEDRFGDTPFMGCGAFNPQVALNAAERANEGQGRAQGNELNRRVVFYLLRRRPRTVPCRLGTIEPCQVEIARPGMRIHPQQQCAFHDRIAAMCACERPARRRDIVLRLFDGRLRAIPNATFKVVTGPTIKRGTADENGRTTIHDVATAETGAVYWSRPSTSEPSSDDAQDETAEGNAAEANAGEDPPTASEPEGFEGATAALDELELRLYGTESGTAETRAANAPFEDPDGSSGTSGTAVEDAYEFERRIYFEFEVGDGRESARRRLSNFGFEGEGSLPENIREFQAAYRKPQTGALTDEDPVLRGWHDVANPDPIPDADEADASS